MQKTRYFIQYSTSFFSVGVRIDINGNIRKRSEISIYGECKREYDKNRHKQYYILNKKKILKNTRLWSQNNKDRVRELSVLWRRKNPDKIAYYNAIHREFGFEPLNDWFEGAHFHHTHKNGNHNVGVFIPQELHRSVYHSYKNKNSMDEINKVVDEWLVLNTICI